MVRCPAPLIPQASQAAAMLTVTWRDLEAEEKDFRLARAVVSVNADVTEDSLSVARASRRGLIRSVFTIGQEGKKLVCQSTTSPLKRFDRTCSLAIV